MQGIQNGINSYSFGTFGPFELPTVGGVDIDRKNLRSFWKAIETQHPGLPEALGCYVFVIDREASLLPWYVGKTEQRSFQFESVQPHKLILYNEALKAAKGKKASLFLLPRLTKASKFRKVWINGSSSVDRLEGMLIAAASEQNPLLTNTRSRKHLTQTIVPGFCNDQEKSRSVSARQFARAMGTLEENSVAALISKTIRDALTKVDLEMNEVFTPTSRLKLLISHDGADYELILQPYSDAAEESEA